jgi:hypothetical protein
MASRHHSDLARFEQTRSSAESLPVEHSVWAKLLTATETKIPQRFAIGPLDTAVMVPQFNFSKFAHLVPSIGFRKIV